MAHFVTSIYRASAIAEWWLDDAGVQLCSLYAKPTVTPFVTELTPCEREGEWGMLINAVL